MVRHHQGGKSSTQSHPKDRKKIHRSQIRISGSRSKILIDKTQIKVEKADRPSYHWNLQKIIRETTQDNQVERKSPSNKMTLSSKKQRNLTTSSHNRRQLLCSLSKQTLLTKTLVPGSPTFQSRKKTKTQRSSSRLIQRLVSLQKKTNT